MSTPLAIFGPGILIVTRTDVTIPAPVNVGYAQEFSIEAASTAKQLFGQNQWPLAVARGTIKGTGKFKTATVSGQAWASLFYGQTPSTGGIAWTIGSTYTTGSTGGTGSLQIGSSTTFEADLGITYSTSKLPLQRVSTGSEAVGKYSITAGSPGLYNFADQGANIKVTYTSTTATGQSITVSNQLIGSTPTFQLDYYTNFNQPSAKPFVVRLYVAIAEKHSMQFKLEDFMIPEFDFMLAANSADQVFDMVFPEVS